MHINPFVRCASPSRVAPVTRSSSYVCVSAEDKVLELVESVVRGREWLRRCKRWTSDGIQPRWRRRAAVAYDVQEEYTAVQMTVVFIHLTFIAVRSARSASHQVTIRSRQASVPESPAPAVVSVVYNELPRSPAVSRRSRIASARLNASNDSKRPKSRPSET